MCTNSLASEMNKSVVAMEESHQISDFEASASKLGSLVQINSIAIDISASAMEEIEAPTHEHFSIRGFVAGIRKKNSKTCLPFPSEGINDADMINKYLPPILVPRFRWWQCSNCVPDIAMKTTQETAETSRSDIATCSCQNVGEKTASFLYSSESIVAAVPDENLGAIQNISAVSEEKTKVTEEANPVHIRERLNNTSDVSEKPGNASSGKDITFSALSHRRKPKLRSLADILVEVNNTLTDSPKKVQITSSTETEEDLGQQIELNVAKATKIPERKRMIALEEDREPRGSIYQSASKKIKGPMLDAEKKFKRVEISETESEGDGFMRFYQHTKPKRNKSLDTMKKIKQIRTENGPGSGREFPKIGVKCTSNLQKRAASQEASFGKLDEMGAYFRSILSGQQTQRMPNVSEKMLDVAVMPNGKGILDLSLDSYRSHERNSKRDIPDLNVEFCQNVKQFSADFEKRNLPQDKSLDVSASSSKEKAREGKLPGSSKPPRKDSNKELFASDDIPMEIVELMAKNQHERALGNSNRHINNSSREYRPPHVDTHSNTIYFPPLNRQSNISANFPPLKNSQLELTKPDQFRLFTSSTQSQQRNKTYFSTSTSTDLLWPPRRENLPPFPFSHSIQPNSTSVHLFTGQRHKGKNICDIKDKRDMIKEGRIVSGSTSIGSLDPYTNDTIPAMQLLSLMDQRVVAGPSFDKLGTNSFLDKPFSPCTHHARVNGKENHNFFSGPFFPQNSHSKDFSVARYGFHSSSESSKKVPSYLQGQGSLEIVNPKANPLRGSSSVEIRPARSNNLALGVCTLNRNPADFSFPDARNEFTISAKDLKPRKRNVSKEKLHLVNGEQRKKQRKKKDEHSSKNNRGLY
ncbi:hypothetical protein CASFOL_007220 [Castilleja foliolosa]|uniref:Protein EMBRYONIC FLOWER 1-like n=1 Tax=Castilleja foliolosa TaxID=1961234 RepID=A0ABD3E959_9LAMI